MTDKYTEKYLCKIEIHRESDKPINWTERCFRMMCIFACWFPFFVFFLCLFTFFFIYLFIYFWLYRSHTFIYLFFFNYFLFLLLSPLLLVIIFFICYSFSFFSFFHEELRSGTEFHIFLSPFLFHSWGEKSDNISPPFFIFLL